MGWVNLSARPTMQAVGAQVHIATEAAAEGKKDKN